MKRTTTKTTGKYIAILVLICGLLIGLRWAWTEIFHVSKEHRPIDGVLDLRGVDLDQSPAIALNGNWHFYPGQLLTSGDIGREEARFVNLQVPGDWGGAFREDTGTSHGYGTYRLRILIDPPDQPVTFWAQRIQASSELEINGEITSVDGKVADNREDYTPKRISYTAAYAAEGATEIELLVRAANFDDAHKGGIGRAVLFGSQAAIDTIRWYSIGFQLVAFVVLLLHGLYACILYLFNPREKALILFALMALMVGLSIVSDHDNLLTLWLPVNYAWAVKIRLLSYMWLSFFILLLFRRVASVPPNSVWLRIYTVAFAAYSAFLIAAPVPLVYDTMELRLFSFFYLFPIAWFVYLLLRMLFSKLDDDAIFFLMSGAGIASSVIWGALNDPLQISVVYYPVDIIVAIIGFSTYWFKKYFRHSMENARLNEQLKEADKLKDQFLAHTSHELRTPLHGIMNIARNIAAKEKGSMRASSLKDMELLITISRRMSHLLGDLLDVARLREHRIALRLEPLKIQAIVPGVISMLSYMAEGKPVRMHSDLAETLPPALADEKRLVQILYNLLHNAIKYTERGTISVFAEIRDGQIVVAVSDTGVGMSEETQARIFLPYEQGTYGISVGGGFGLGLSICKQLVELHGGELTVRSEPGNGSVFRFGLPLASETHSPSPLPSAPFEGEFGQPDADAAGLRYPEASSSEIAATAAAFPNIGKANILAVDDDPVNLNVLVGMLPPESYHVETAKSAGEALSLLDQRQWDLLIADVMMPRISGYELTKSVRERFSLSELPVLLLTARSQPADIYAGFAAGANDYVAKPVDALELKYRIRALIELRQSFRERLRMEAAYLQAQIQPHFLFNTLNSLMALSDIDATRMRKLGDAFASFLRISFDYLNTGELVDLFHELQLVKAYLYIEKERFEDRLTVEWEVEPGLNLRLPPLSIQPLVENAVKHGLLSRNIGGVVRLQVIREDGWARIEVQDNGKGMAPDKVEQLLNPTASGRGVGLSNTNRRLRQLYGHGLSIESKAEEGTTVSFKVPIFDHSSSFCSD
ncbi:ATP-binding protein [Paenibacillaceae bacterium WGS1546]|uniref:ATP-binding protein n=1 Tax=Cohnella sp. WGS1546 TaxID=3366810 RepID=UPI00372D20AF